MQANASLYTHSVNSLVVLLVSSIAVAFAFTQAYGAENSDDLSVDVGECVKLQSESERFACYERQVAEARAKTEKDAAAGAHPDSDARSSAQSNANSNSGVNANSGAVSRAGDNRASTPAADRPGPSTKRAESSSVTRHADERLTRQGENDTKNRARRSDRAHDEAEDAETREFRGTIAALREIAPNRFLITMTDGQVWRQTRSEIYPLQVGTRVRIYPTRWGSSYRLTVEELRGFIQVDRVQ
jgi:hypothetical protein